MWTRRGPLSAQQQAPAPVERAGLSAEGSARGTMADDAAGEQEAPQKNGLATPHETPPACGAGARASSASGRRSSLPQQRKRHRSCCHGSATTDTGHVARDTRHQTPYTRASCGKAHSSRPLLCPTSSRQRCRAQMGAAQGVALESRRAGQGKVGLGEMVGRGCCERTREGVSRAERCRGEGSVTKEAPARSGDMTRPQMRRGAPGCQCRAGV